VAARIATSTVLFIGYSLSDWNFRVIYKATAEANRDHEAYAVQLHAPRGAGIQLEMDNLKWKRSVKFWEEKKVNIINADAALFMDDLCKAVTRQLQMEEAAPHRV
jgi:hypothetical protein